MRIVRRFRNQPWRQAALVSLAVALTALLMLLSIVSCSSGNGTRNPAAVGEISQEEYAVYSEVLRVEAGAMRGDRIILQDETIPFSRSGPESDETIDMYLGLRPVSSVVERDRVGENHYLSVLKKVNEFGALLSPSLVEEFLSKNEKEYRLENKFESNLKVILLSKSENDTLTSSTTASFWRSLYAKYPDAKGTINLSRVGFEQGGTKALVIYYYARASQWGEGVLILLEKKEGRWQIVKRVRIWES